MTHTKSFGTIGTIGRFKPVHKGHTVMLEALCQQAEHVIIGIGSSNKHDYRNPFTAQESMAMIDLFLKPTYSNYSFIEVPDFDNGPVWRQHILALYGPLDAFASANNYVRSLLKDDYKLILPITLVPKEKHVYLSATMVRIAMARGEQWEYFVPEIIVSYIKKHRLDERFCNEFGLATIAVHSQDIFTEVTNS